MNEIIENLFKTSGFEKIELLNEDISFYSRKKTGLADYFLVYEVCIDDYNYKYNLKILNKLEELYIADKELMSIRKQIMDVDERFVNTSEVDKNLSALYLVKTPEKSGEDAFKENIYQVEENPKYFKKYVLTYSKSLEESLKEKIDGSIERTLNTLINNLSLYEDTFKNNNDLYKFILRMFSKLPFLEYKYNVDSELKELELIFKERIEAQPKISEILLGMNDLIDEEMKTGKYLEKLEDLEFLPEVESDISNFKKEIYDERV